MSIGLTIATWRERIGTTDSFPLHAPTDVERAMVAEIADLRTRLAREERALEPVEGDLLPQIGSKVLIHLTRRDAWVEHTVVGYYVWFALSHQVKDDKKNAHRVFVRVKDADGHYNARLLSEVRPADTVSPEQKQRKS